MGYSVGFLRSFLSFIALVALIGLLVGAANELFGLGLFADGYPAPLRAESKPGFGAFAIQLGIVAVLSSALNILLERRDR